LAGASSGGVTRARALAAAAAERDGNNFEDFKDFYPKNGSSQAQNLAVTVFFVPDSLDRGSRAARRSYKEKHSF